MVSLYPKGQGQTGVSQRKWEFCPCQGTKGTFIEHLLCARPWMRCSTLIGGFCFLQHDLSFRVNLLHKPFLNNSVFKYTFLYFYLVAQFITFVALLSFTMCMQFLPMYYLFTHLPSTPGTRWRLFDNQSSTPFVHYCLPRVTKYNIGQFVKFEFQIKMNNSACSIYGTF